MSKITIKQSDLKSLITEAVNNILMENMYDDDWVSMLQKYFKTSNVELDKQEEITPFYGGGTYEQVSFKVTLEQPISWVGSFIVHGIMFNGRFIYAALILFDTNDIGMYHGMLPIIDYKSNNGKINDICEKINQKLNKI